MRRRLTGLGNHGRAYQRLEACYPVVSLGLVLKAWPSTSAKKGCQISLSEPGAAYITAVDAVAIFDSGSGITTMSAGIANNLQAAFPDVQVVGGMAHPGKLKVTDGRVLVVQERTCPVRIALHTSWGLVTMDPFSFAVMSGDDDVVILDNPTLKLLGSDVYDILGTRARECAALTGVDTAAYRQCRRVIVSVDSLQQQQCGAPEEPDEAVERLMARGPKIDMSPEEELRDRCVALEEVVLASAAAGLDESHVERLCDAIGRRLNAFRRGLRRVDPPAPVEPLRVTLKPGARPVKARPRVYTSRPPLVWQHVWLRSQLWGLFS